MLYYQKCNCQPLIISNWNNGKFSSYLEVENFQACFCLCPPPFLLSPRAKKIFRAREKFFSFPTVLGVQDWRVPSFLPNALQTLEGRFPFPAALFFKFFYPRRPRRTPLQLATEKKTIVCDKISKKGIRIFIYFFLDIFFILVHKKNPDFLDFFFLTKM